MMRTGLLLLALILSSCGWLTPYKMDIREGNLITPDMREKLKIGMKQQQVRYLLGTPTITDPFNSSRWDYVYRYESGGKFVEQQGLTLYFEGDTLVHIVDTRQHEPVAAKPAEPSTR